MISMSSSLLAAFLCFLGFLLPLLPLPSAEVPLADLGVLGVLGILGVLGVLGFLPDCCFLLGVVLLDGSITISGSKQESYYYMYYRVIIRFWYLLNAYNSLNISAIFYKQKVICSILSNILWNIHEKSAALTENKKDTLMDSRLS